MKTETKISEKNDNVFDGQRSSCTYGSPIIWIRLVTVSFKHGYTAAAAADVATVRGCMHPRATPQCCDQ